MKRNPGPIVGCYFIPEDVIQLTLGLSVGVSGHIWIEFQEPWVIDAKNLKNEAGSH